MDTKSLLLSFINCPYVYECVNSYTLKCLACVHNEDKRVVTNRPKRDHYGSTTYRCSTGRCEL